jgi:DNA-binding response OmpR family regulator
MRKKQILIVDDELGILQFLKEGLQEEGYQVHTALNGKDGLQMALKQPIDLILLDWMMPKMNGVDFCKHFREHNQSTPIIFLTAKDRIEEVVEGLKAGANDYMKKPFSFEELLARIEVYFRNTPENKIIEIGSKIKIKPDQREVWENETLINLTQKEYDLLYFLASQKGRICTRDEIIDHVWDIHFGYDSGVIDVFMNALRKKIPSLKTENLIQTIRGIGYKIS